MSFKNHPLNKDNILKRWHDAQKLPVREKQDITKNLVRNLMLQTYEDMKVAYLQGQQLYLDNPLGLTPEQVIHGFGTDAMEVLRLQALLKEVLNIVVPGTIPHDDNPYC